MQIEIKLNSYKAYLAIAKNYPREFFEILRKHYNNNSYPYLLKANCYHNGKQWDALPEAAKIHFFRWLIEEGERIKRPLQKVEANKRLKEFYYRNYDLYNKIRNIIDCPKVKVFNVYIVYIIHFTDLIMLIMST